MLGELGCVASALSPGLADTLLNLREGTVGRRPGRPDCPAATLGGIRQASAQKGEVVNAMIECDRRRIEKRKADVRLNRQCSRRAKKAATGGSR